MKKYFCCDVGGLSLKYSVIDTKFKIYFSDQFNYNLPPKEFIWKKLRQIYLSLKDKYDLQGIAISAAGIYDSRNGIVHYLSSDEKKPESIKFLLNLEDVDIRIDNDARCALRAEKVLGVAQPYDNFVMYTIGTSLGASICLNNKIITGKKFVAGEIGCGFFDFKNKINISKFCGMYGLQERYELEFGKIKNAKEIWTLAEANQNGREFKIVNEQVFKLSELIVNTSILLDLELVLIGGAVSRNEFFIKEIQKTVSNLYKSTGLDCNVKISPCKFLNDAGKIGALLLFTEKN